MSRIMNGLMNRWLDKLMGGWIYERGLVGHLPDKEGKYMRCWSKLMVAERTT